ncbi:MAG: type III pantothenate kinase [Proteobacteria bacterium]|nr:type III pantothenate kinase [Pseudomonadota bacterium]
MLLAIDAGNTNIVFALMEGADIRQQWRLETDAAHAGDSCQSWLSEALEGAGVDAAAIDGAIIACVVPKALQPLKDTCAALFGVSPLVVGEDGVDIGIEVRISSPGDVGADRLVNAVAAHHEVEGKCIVLDFGTATTFDVVGADGAYLGGVICPGINLSLKALYEAAAKLPLIEIREPENGRVTGGSTEEAMQSGIFWGYVGLIEGIVARLRAEHGGITRVFATGGLAGIFAEHTEAIDCVDRDLTVKGLRLIHDRNSNQDNP